MSEKSKVKILIADDEKPLSKALSLKLSKSGYEVDTADDGAVAIDKLSSGKYSMLLLDLVMPNKNGFDVLEELKNMNMLDSLTIFVLSNLGQPEDIKKTQKFGVKNYLVKSNTTLAEIVKMIDSYIESETAQ